MRADADPITTEYFAKLPALQLTKQALRRVRSYDDHVDNSGRLAIWKKSYTYYHHAIYNGGRLNRVGEQGEYTEIFVNHFRNLLTHIVNMTTGQPPSFDCRAINTDYESQAQTIIGNNIVDYYNRAKSLRKNAKKSVEDVLVFGDSYIYQGWDFLIGDPAQPDPYNKGKIVRQGDIFHKNFTPVDVIFDWIGGLQGSDRQWHILRDFQNKWDLIERYPEKREHILRASEDQSTWERRRIGNQFDIPPDQMPVFIFVHDRTAALPDGRFFTFISDDCWFIDSALPSFYKDAPIHRICAAEESGSGFGYSMAFDLLPVQEGVSGLYSTIITNQRTFGVQNILMPKGADIDVVDLGDGLKQLSYDPKVGEPKALSLVATAPEIFKFLELLEHVMETMSGVNSVARGNPEASLKSGAALALVQSMALQFVSGLQESYASLLESIGTGLISILKETATTPRMIEIAGRSNQSYMKAFTSKDISNISRVVVDMGNPISRTTAGRVSMADSLLQAGMIANPQQYIQVLTTGKLEPVIESTQAELMLIRSENEALSRGESVMATIVDDHSTHVLEHRVVLSSPEGRRDAKVVTETTNHIQEHIDLWKTADVSLLTMLKQPLPPPIMPPALPEPGSTGGAPEIAPGNPEALAGAEVGLPNLPTNPLTGELANPGGIQ